LSRASACAQAGRETMRRTLYRAKLKPLGAKAVGISEHTAQGA